MRTPSEDALWAWSAALLPRVAGLNALVLGPVIVYADRFTSELTTIEVDLQDQHRWSDPDRALVEVITGGPDPGDPDLYDPSRMGTGVAELLMVLAALADTAPLVRRSATDRDAAAPSGITGIEQYAIWPQSRAEAIVAHAFEWIERLDELLSMIGGWPTDAAEDILGHLEWATSYATSTPQLRLNDAGEPTGPGQRGSSLIRHVQRAHTSTLHPELRAWARVLAEVIGDPTDGQPGHSAPIQREYPPRPNSGYNVLKPDTPLPPDARALRISGPMARVDHRLAGGVFAWMAMLAASSNHLPDLDLEERSRIESLWRCSAWHWTNAERPREAAIASDAADGSLLPHTALEWPSFARLQARDFSAVLTAVSSTRTR